MQVLILAGTTEAMALARLLQEHPTIVATVSLAGRTKKPAPTGLPQRSGGFGGVDGLVSYLHEQGIRAIVDATHPFANQISTNAAIAAATTGIPLVTLSRPAWQPQSGDHWRIVPDLYAAAEALRSLGQRVLITTGRQELAPFANVPEKHYVIRTIEPPDKPPELPYVRFLYQRGPFDRMAEATLLETYGIEVLVTKNSGGEATRSKLDAARERGIPVVMVQRPPRPRGITIHENVSTTLDWLEHLAP